MSALRSFLTLLRRGLKSAPVFTAGYVVGGIIVGLFTQAPVLAHAALAVLK